MAYCLFCGSSLGPYDDHCPQCGRSVTADPSNSPELTPAALPPKPAEDAPKKSGAGRIVALLVVLALAIGGGYYLYTLWNDGAFDSLGSSSSSSAASEEPEYDGSSTSIDAVATPIGNTPPAFTSWYASSELPGDSVTSYYGVDNAFDGDYSTAWNEGAPGFGIDEYIAMSADEPQLVSGVAIVGGYPKSEDVYYNNARPCDITILLDDGFYTFTMEDLYSTEQVFEFDQPVATTSLSVIVNSVYLGTDYEDLAIAEIRVF